MPYPIQNVNAFSEAELWYIYQQLIEINTNTSGGSGGLTQTELFEVFNGTNSQGLAVSLFESLSGGDTPLANILVETISGNTYSISNVCYNSFLEQQTTNSALQSIDAKTSNVVNNTGNTSINTGLMATTLNNINSAIGTTNTYLSTIRTPVLTSITGSLTIAVQIHNLSIYNSGASAGTINVDGGGAISIPAGVTINFDAGGNNNRYAINKFVLNATGTTFLVSYTS